jgi:hypothetical protein
MYANREHEEIAPGKIGTGVEAASTITPGDGWPV